MKPYLLIACALCAAVPAYAQSPVFANATHAASDTVRPAPSGAAPATLPELLTGASPRLYVRWGSGVQGAAPWMWARGPASVLLTSSPLIAVDGVPQAPAPLGQSMPIGTAFGSRLDDFDPADVESVVILPGIAAAALYGPSAANGVIDIRTRRGSAGRPRVHAYGGMRLRQDAAAYPANYGRPGRRSPITTTNACTLADESAGICVPTGDVISWNPLREVSPFRAEWGTEAGASVAGGLPAATYRVAARHLDEPGVLSTEARTRTLLSGAGAFTPGGGLRLSGWASDARTRGEVAPNDNTLISYLGAGLMGHPVDDPVWRGYRAFFPANPSRRDQSRALEVDRTTVQVDATWQSPLPWLSLGARWAEDRAAETIGLEPGTGYRAESDRYRRNQQARVVLDGIGVGALRGRTMLGAERGRRSARRWEGVPMESFTEWRFGTDESAIFGQQQITLGAHRRLEGSARRDRFDFPDDAVWSYALSGEWKPGAEPWARHSRLARAVTLRAAAGSTRRMDAFEQLAPFRGGVPIGMEPDVVQMEQVRTMEAGADIAFSPSWGLSGTAYRQRTDDVLAFSTRGRRNAGQIRNHGVEILLHGDGRLVRGLTWSGRVGAAYNRNEADGDVGVRHPQWHQGPTDEGSYPLHSFFGRRIVGAPAGGCPGGACVPVMGADIEHLGTAVPPRRAVLTAGVAASGRATFTARVEHQGGHRTFNRTEEFRCMSFGICEAAYVAGASPDRELAIAAGWAGSDAGFLEDAAFVKLREVRLVLHAPRRLIRGAGVTGLDLTFSGQNVGTATRYSGLDPETGGGTQRMFGGADFLTRPLPRVWTTRLDVRL